MFSSEPISKPTSKNTNKQTQSLGKQIFFRSNEVPIFHFLVLSLWEYMLTLVPAPFHGLLHRHHQFSTSKVFPISSNFPAGAVGILLCCPYTPLNCKFWEDSNGGRCFHQHLAKSVASCRHSLLASCVKDCPILLSLVSPLGSIITLSPGLKYQV